MSVIFSNLSNSLFRTFRERAPLQIEFQDDENVYDIEFIDHRNYERVDKLGMQIEASERMVQIKASDIVKFAADRDIHSSDLLKNDGRDKIYIQSTQYDIESCTADGQGWCKVTLVRAN